MSQSEAAPFGALLCQDIFFVSKLTGTASQLGLSLRMVNRTTIIPALAVADCRVVVVDLSDRSVNLTELKAAPTAGQPLRWIAFGSHVDTAGLQSAREAGFEVLPRSKLSDQLPALLADWLTDLRP